MPRPKKTEKLKKEEVVLDLRQDREEFLRAFEKPTQIYRFLRARHCISPVFLHRSLLYMLSRCSRNNARRKTFRVNDMLQVCRYNHSTSPGSVSPHCDQIKVQITGFHIDPGVPSENSIGKKLSIVDTEISVRKTFRCRRKDGESIQTEEYIDTVEVSVNPRNPDAEDPVLLHTNDISQSNDGQSVKNYSLIFRVYEPCDDFTDTPAESSDNPQSDDEMDDDDTDGRKRKHKDDPAAISLRNLTSGSRRRRVLHSGGKNCSDNEDEHQSYDAMGPPRKFKKLTNERAQTPMYEAELDIFTSDKQSLLLDGEYELSLNRKSPGSRDGKRNATWEALDGGREIKVLSTMANSPVLKFKLEWAENDKPGPLCDQASENKANNCDEPEAKRVRRRNSNKAAEEDKNGLESKDHAEQIPPKLAVDSTEYRKESFLKKKLVNGFNSNGSSELKSVVCYQFIYNSETQQQTEAREDLYCPWCQLNCVTLYGLIKHLKTNHPRFNFSYIPQTSGCCIEVSVNECYDGSYCGNPQFVYSQPGMAFSRRGPVRRVQVTDTLVYRPVKERNASKCDLNELLEKEENDSSIATHYDAGHHRLYFHSETNIPIRPCEFDVDSEEEPDPDWLRDHIKKMLDEFTDVNDGEKPIMKLWNLYTMKHSCIADAQMIDACISFIDVYGSIIQRHNLRRNLLLHLVTLVDFGVLKTSALLSLMQHFDKSFGKSATSTNQLHHSNSASGDNPTKSRYVGADEKVATSSTSLKLASGDFYDSDKSTNLARLQKIINDSQHSVLVERNEE